MRALMIVSLGAATLITGCAEGNPEMSEGEEHMALAEIVGQAALISTDGEEVGTASLAKEGSRLEIELGLAGLEPGTHALHLHTTGLCDAPDFKSAGGHLNPAGKAHGKLSEGGAHLGDLPNIDIPEDGKLALTVSVEGDAAANLATIFDADGTALMIHTGADDYKSDPAGAAGPRIACGVVQGVPSEEG